MADAHMSEDNLHLEADTEREGEGQDDQQEGDGGEDAATQADSGLILLSCLVVNQL